MTGCGDDSGIGGTGAATWSGGGGQGGGGGGSAVTCLAAEGEPTPGSETWKDDAHQATVTVEGRETCGRSYRLETSAPRRDDLPGNPRTIVEAPSQPIARTGNDMFDALYALAIEESRESSVDSISNVAFNGGQPIPCPDGGCFETGRLWTYVWTRDTAYAMALGLASFDPRRAKSSLEIKTSLHRDGTRREIVQDTGTGGSWPISTDRVVWAIGAWELLKFLDGDERTAFRDLAFEAIKNTAEHDRSVIWDPRDGLYRGEQSFLDWREQTYPAWTATDPVQIGMSKSLSTNIGHLRMLEVAAALASEKGETDASSTFAGWASALRDAIRSELYLADARLFSTYAPTELDAAAVSRFDLLGSAFAVLFDVAEPQEAEGIVSSYPQLPKGPAVVWPQQQDTPIYHNRSMWPFVTAFWAKAAAKVGNASVTDHSIRSLMRGAALNLSNMENFEAVTGAAWLDDGAASGPVVNSQRQLWSVAGYLAMVQDIVFGLDASQTGLRFRPHISAELRETLFSGAESIALSNLSYRNKRLSVRVRFPAERAGTGFFEIATVRLNGKDIGADYVLANELEDDNVFEIDLAPGAASVGEMTLLEGSTIADYKNVFGPRTPSIVSVTEQNGLLAIAWDAAGEQDVTFDVYRDGERVAEALTTTSWTDTGSADHASVTHCYSVDSRFTSSGTTSQHARPVCHWGPADSRIQTYDAQQFTAEGGALVMNHGRFHYEDWGDPADTLTLAGVVPTSTGEHLLQVVAGNGAGDFSTGITCGVKAVEVWDGATLIGSGQLVMPHLATWSEWRDSSFVRVSLVSGTSYTIVIREDEASGNMSDLEHFSLYGGTGGVSGRFNKVNIAEVKLLAIGE